jgi:hypothetical protein
MGKDVQDNVAIIIILTDKTSAFWAIAILRTFSQIWSGLDNPV